MESWINFNGTFMAADSPVVSANNRGLRYGDGLFETMRVIDGTLALKQLHFNRLFAGIKLLQISLQVSVTADYLEDQIFRTIAKNEISGNVRVRLMVIRGDGSLHDTAEQGGGFIIQVSVLPASNLFLNENGLIIGLYKGGRKACDLLANVKSNNYLLYVMAALHASQNTLNDCLVLNHYDRVCEATIANLFWIKNGEICTPPLSEGCVAGVMRQHLLDTLSRKSHSVIEKWCNIEDLLQADEIFLTNALYGLRWVKAFNGKIYPNNISRQLFQSTI